jgi:glycosyltransferase involved in cell wall biosynthesis
MKIGISLLSQAQSQFTGTSRYVSELVRSLASLGEVELDVLCNEPAMAQAADWAGPNVTVKRATGYADRTSRISRLGAMAGAVALPARLARQFSPDVAAIQYPLIIPIPRVRLPTLVNLHDVLHKDHPEQFTRAQLGWRRFAYDRAARESTLVLTLSRYSRERIIERLGVMPDRVKAIPLAVDPSRFRPEPGPDEAERLASLGLPERFLFYPASLWPHKNHSNLLRAMARMDDPGLHLVLSGATFGRLEDLLEEAGRLGIGDRVRHLGFIGEADLPVVYRRATGLAFPSMYEGFGTPPLEAMACGCPVASSLETSLAEVCGEAALELVPGDEAQMAAQLTSLVSDERLRGSLRKRGRQRSSEFSWMDVARAHLDAYRLALSLDAEGTAAA